MAFVYHSFDRGIEIEAGGVEYQVIKLEIKCKGHLVVEYIRILWIFITSRI